MDMIRVGLLLRRVTMKLGPKASKLASQRVVRQQVGSTIHAAMEIASLPKQRSNIRTEPLHGTRLTSTRGSLATKSNAKCDLKGVHAVPEKMNLLLLKSHHLARSPSIRLRCLWLVAMVVRGHRRPSLIVMGRSTTTWNESSGSGSPMLQADCPKAVAIWDEKQRQLRK
ncbi:hypothetical protein PF005_g25074 [Phytophthora fragariae]|uniref:Uncharacterized protein n=2 Tax=Phytophthora fragariae TaxID=53985 RepID=A0A6A4CGL1_9STRA|nr:hypothetical protein PF003_g33578 [Phytophthora fragariae]KAE8923889.1 hypothetical protein PF009_g25864 [Phytophthora fragariae]KAE9071953.1 hypothetical protein PF007_g26353 [Phytophthora fragariae]KAE9072909.1 hypothetical protein PF010_g25294 [Phytophthora fragariae]KAE9170206.1 hypothetical protein PF002_g30151 [Phytophthora fragariae]